MISASLLRFLVVGAVNTLFGLLVIWAAKRLFGLGDVASNGVGYTIGILVSFFLNKQWTFGFHGEPATALLRFIGVFLVAYAANLIAVLSCIKIVPLDPFWCQSFGIIPYALVLYLGSRWYVFHPARAHATDER